MKVKPNPSRSAGVLVRYLDGKAYRIEGPTDIPTELATRLLEQGSVVKVEAARKAAAKKPAAKDATTTGGRVTMSTGEATPEG